MPERNPLHPEALTLEDIKPGLIMQPYYQGQKEGEQLIVVDQPCFERLSYGYSLHIKVALKRSWNDEAVVHNRFLADLGVVPYEDSHWNLTRYTLAATD